jgi:hypothetical protein
MIKCGHQLDMVLARPGRKVALGGGDRVRRDEVGRRRRVLGVCACVLAHSHVCVRAQVKQIGQGSAPRVPVCLCVVVWSGRQRFGPAVVCTGLCAPATNRGGSNALGGEGRLDGISVLARRGCV